MKKKIFVLIFVLLFGGMTGCFGAPVDDNTRLTQEKLDSFYDECFTNGFEASGGLTNGHISTYFDPSSRTFYMYENTDDNMVSSTYLIEDKELLLQMFSNKITTTLADDFDTNEFAKSEFMRLLPSYLFQFDAWREEFDNRYTYYLKDNDDIFLRFTDDGDYPILWMQSNSNDQISFRIDAYVNPENVVSSKEYHFDYDELEGDKFIYYGYEVEDEIWWSDYYVIKNGDDISDHSRYDGFFTDPTRKIMDMNDKYYVFEGWEPVRTYKEGPIEFYYFNAIEKVCDKTRNVQIKCVDAVTGEVLTSTSKTIDRELKDTLVKIDAPNVDNYLPLNNFDQKFLTVSDEGEFTFKYTNYSTYTGDASTGFSDGTGEEDNPYLISSGEDYAYFVNQVASGNTFEGKYLKLTTTIDFGHKSVPVKGTFSGTFDGNNLALANLHIAEKNSSTGVYYADNAPFANVTNGTIKNLNVTGDSESGVVGNSGSAGIVAYAKNANLINLNNYLTVTTVGRTGAVIQNVGGICGEMNRGLIKDCNNYADLKISSTYAGGIVGKLYGSVENCNNYANLVCGCAFSNMIDNINLLVAGGIVGCQTNSFGEIKDCTNYGKISTTSNSSFNMSHIGGIIGYADGTIQNTVNYGEVVAQLSACSAGGIAGFIYANNTKFISVINHGLVNSRKHSGGIVGQLGRVVIEVSFDSCENYGTVGGDNCGGILGSCWNYGNELTTKIEFKNCKVICDFCNSWCGGLVGEVCRQCALSLVEEGSIVDIPLHLNYTFVASISGETGLNLGETYIPEE